MLKNSLAPRRRRSLLSALVLALALVILSACGGGTTPAPSGQSNGAQSGQSTAAPAGATTGQPVKIVWWSIQTAENEKKNWQDMADAYMKDHPDVSIEITVLENEAFKTKLATAMQSGSPPDIFQSWGGGVLKQYARRRAGAGSDTEPSGKRLGRQLPARSALAVSPSTARATVCRGTPAWSASGTTRSYSRRPASRNRRQPGLSFSMRSRS